MVLTVLNRKYLLTYYLGCNDNGNGHLVFKLDTKSVISVNSFRMVNTPTSVIDRVNKMTKVEKQPDGIQFISNGVLLFKNLYLNSFKPDKEYEEEY